MTLTLRTYSDLQSRIAEWLNRDDLTTTIPTFIELAEARIRRNQEWFQITYSAANGGNALTITANPQVVLYIKEITALWASTSTFKHTIEVIPISAWRDLAASNRDANGIPTKAALIPRMSSEDIITAPSLSMPVIELHLWPAPALDGSFAVDFLALWDVAPISVSVPVLFLRHPDLYLYGALVEAAPYLLHDERVPLWETRYQQAMREIQKEREHLQYGAGAKRMRLPRVF